MKNKILKYNPELKILSLLAIFLSLIPNIKSQSCYPNPCQNGNCIANGSGFRCICLPGYSGLTCDQYFVNPCLPNPCYNSGKCSSNDGRTYRCTCPPNFSGVRCEKQTVRASDVCQVNSCLNGGTCIPIAQANIYPPYACVCPSGLTGLRCEILMNTNQITNPCSSNPCSSGSTCIANTQSPNYPSYFCLCSPSYTGTLCNLLISPQTTRPVAAATPCSSNPCQNSGTCLPITQTSYTASSFVCLCPPNYTGLTCNQLAQSVLPSATVCSSNPCQYGGTCLPITSPTQNTFVCICPPSYTGLTCTQLAISVPAATVCSSNPCQNSGTCLPITQADGTQNTYVCLCPPSYTGLTCSQLATSSQNTNACSTNPCQYGGTCVQVTPAYSSQSSFVCICPPAYTGTTCNQLAVAQTTTPALPTTLANPCASNPCYSGSTCFPISQPFVNPPYACVCPINYTGPRCDQLIPSPTTTTTQAPIYPIFTISPVNPVYPVVANPCNSNPCAYGSTCVPVSTIDFICTCPPSYTGKLCNQLVAINTPQPPYIPLSPINNCNSNPCLNGATCISSSIGYSCQCPTGFIGIRCEQRQLIDLCNMNTCYNGGSCQTQSRTPDQYTVVCFCPAGYTGSRCQIPLFSSTTVSTTTQPPRVCLCQNGGVCRADGTCQCYGNYYGASCEYLNAAYQPATSTANVCPPGLCVQGRCAAIPQGGASYCICNLGWTGPRCNVRNYCQSLTTLCQNGGSCINQANGYSCSCPPSVYGQFCENVLNSYVPINPVPASTQCTSNICLNGGSCYIKNNAPTCQCQRGYIGLKCEQDVCRQGINLGSCFASIQRYYYNSNLKICQPFTYGGCGGNENNFDSMTTCQNNCNGH